MSTIHISTSTTLMPIIKHKKTHHYSITPHSIHGITLSHHHTAPSYHHTIIRHHNAEPNTHSPTQEIPDVQTRFAKMLQGFFQPIPDDQDHYYYYAPSHADQDQKREEDDTYNEGEYEPSAHTSGGHYEQEGEHVQEDEESYHMWEDSHQAKREIPSMDTKNSLGIYNYPLFLKMEFTLGPKKKTPPVIVGINTMPTPQSFEIINQTPHKQAMLVFRFATLPAFGTAVSEHGMHGVLWIVICDDN